MGAPSTSCAHCTRCHACACLPVLTSFCLPPVLTCLHLRHTIFAGPPTLRPDRVLALCHRPCRPPRLLHHLLHPPLQAAGAGLALRLMEGAGVGAVRWPAASLLWARGGAGPWLWRMTPASALQTARRCCGCGRAGPPGPGWLGMVE